MSTAVIFAGVLLICAGIVLAQDEGNNVVSHEGHDHSHEMTNNCTDDVKDGYMESCSNELTELKEHVKELKDLGMTEDPLGIWMNEKNLCSNPEELGKVMRCYYSKIKECHANSSKADDLADPEKVEAAMIYVCAEQERVYSVHNQSDVDDCLKDKKPDADSCMVQRNQHQQAVSDKCLANDMLVGCLTPLDVCTDGPVFEKYADYFRPAHCAACKLSGLALVFLVGLSSLLVSVFN